MEPWAHDIIKSTDKKVKVVDASFGVELVKEEKEHEHDHEVVHHHKSGKEHHDHDRIDPHIWLDFDNAKTMAANITKHFPRLIHKTLSFTGKILKTISLNSPNWTMHIKIRCLPAERKQLFTRALCFWLSGKKI